MSEPWPFQHRQHGWGPLLTTTGGGHWVKGGCVGVFVLLHYWKGFAVLHLSAHISYLQTQWVSNSACKVGIEQAAYVDIFQITKTGRCHPCHRPHPTFFSLQLECCIIRLWLDWRGVWLHFLVPVWFSLLWIHTVLLSVNRRNAFLHKYLHLINVSPSAWPCLASDCQGVKQGTDKLWLVCVCVYIAEGLRWGLQS